MPLLIIESPIVQSWSRFLLREPGEVKASVAHEYCKLILNEVRSDSTLLNPLIDAFKHTSLIYFYPFIYPKYLLECDKPFVKDINPEASGYQPYCPPAIHVRVCY